MFAEMEGESVELNSLPEELRRLMGNRARALAIVAIEEGRCIIRMCGRQYEWPLADIFGAAAEVGLEVLDAAFGDLKSAEFLHKLVKTKHVELHPIVATLMSAMDDTIGHTAPRSKAKSDMVPRYFPGPATAYNSRVQTMKLRQLFNVLDAIFAFIQADQWGPQDIRALCDALVAEAWQPLASSVGTWAGLNCFFDALEEKARLAGYADRGKDGLKEAGPNPGWRAIGPDEIWYPKKKQKSEQGSNERVVPPGEPLREEEGGEEEEQEGGSGTKRARGASAKATASGAAGRKNGRQRGGPKRATVHLTRRSSGPATRGGLSFPDAVTSYGGAGTHSTVAIGDAPAGLLQTVSDNLEALLAGISRDELDAALFASPSPDIVMDNGPSDGPWTNESGDRRGLQPDSASHSPLGRGSEASTLLHGDGGNGTSGSSGVFPAWDSGGFHSPKSRNPSPGRSGGEVAPLEFLPGAIVATSPLPDFGSMEMDRGVSGQAAVPGGGFGVGASPNQREVYWGQESPGNSVFPNQASAGRPLYPTVCSGPATPPVSVFLGRTRDEAAQQNLPSGHLVAAESQARFTDNFFPPGAGVHAGQPHGVGPYAPGQNAPPPGGSYLGASPHGVSHPGAPNSVHNQVYPTQATHQWHPNQGVPLRGDLYSPSAMPPAGGSPQWHYQQQPNPPAQHSEPQFLRSAGPGDDWRSLHSPQNGWAEPPIHFPGQGNPSPAPGMHSHWEALHSPGWQQPEASTGQPSHVPRGTVPARAAAPTAPSTSSKLGSLISALLRSNPKPSTPARGVVSDRGVLQGGPTFHAAQPPPIHTGHPAIAGSALLRPEPRVDPRGVRSAQFRQQESSATARFQGANYRAAPPPHPLTARTELAASRPGRQNEPREVHSAQFRRQVSVGRAPSARFRRKASFKRASDQPQGREPEGEEELEAELAALIESLKLEDRATAKPGPRAEGIPLGHVRGRGAEAAAGAEGVRGKASDGAEGDRRSDDADSDASEYVTTDASGDESDGPFETGPAGAVVKNEDTSSGLPDGAYASAYANAYIPGERPPVSRRQAPRAAPETGGTNVATGAKTAARRGNPPSVSAPELLQRGYRAKPSPGGRLSSLQDRKMDHPAASVYKLQTVGLGELGAMKNLSAAAAAGFPADGTMNGTTAPADLPGRHHGRSGPAPGGAPRRVYPERTHERAGVHGHKRPDSPSSVLSQSLQSSSSEGSKC